MKNLLKGTLLVGVGFGLGICVSKIALNSALEEISNRSHKIYVHSNKEEK